MIVCQKSKIDDWLLHYSDFYDGAMNLTKPKQLKEFVEAETGTGVINYDVLFRRPVLKNLDNFTLMLDESSLIQNENSKRGRFILRHLHPSSVILLSGTPTGGKYEKLWSQMSLLGWKIDKKIFYNHFVDYHWDDSEGFPRMVIDGYKNVERLKRKMRQYGCQFLKTEEVVDLPEQVDQVIRISTTPEYKQFLKKKIIVVEGDELVGDTTLTKMLYSRQLCGHYNQAKLDAFVDLLESSDDRLVVFYNFNKELEKMQELTDRPVSIISGPVKDLTAYEEHSNSVTFVQTAAGAMGLNLQKANKVIYFSPPLSSELYEQSRKRVHRIGQQRTCFYYKLVSGIDARIYRALSMRHDYTEELFLQEEKDEQEN